MFEVVCIVMQYSHGLRVMCFKSRHIKGDKVINIDDMILFAFVNHLRSILFPDRAKVLLLFFS